MYFDLYAQHNSATYNCEVILIKYLTVYLFIYLLGYRENFSAI